MEFFKKYFKGDPNIWAIIIGLSVFSLLAVYSSTGTLAYRFRGGDTSFYVIGHAMNLGLGLFLAFVVHKVPYKYFARLSQWLIWIVPVALALTLVWGISENVASRRIPVLGVTIQTSDIAKLILIAYVARFLALRQERIRDFSRTLAPVYFWICLVCVLILFANLSTACLLFLTCIALLYIGRVHVGHLTALLVVTIIAGGLFVGGLYTLHQHGIRNVVTQRAPTWVNRITGVSDDYQKTQSKIAYGTSGFLGRGPGKSIQRNFLPQSFSDFIFAIIIEEYGLLGGSAVLMLYLALLYRTVIIVRKCNKTFPAFLAAGLALSVVLQALIHMMVVVDIIPVVTGQPLPFISKGGTSIALTGVAFGVILNISREINKEKNVEPLPATIENQQPETT
ncbi:MAG: FtsW/RodA/SpoVE family cell cycle protein [Bacteroidales bacterium]|jgi:cell division protein FtsW|nr:FtsW/RodA/SpoVE family cell cycle protein [Bacteroidales bacterium]